MYVSVAVEVADLKPGIVTAADLCGELPTDLIQIERSRKQELLENRASAMESPLRIDKRRNLVRWARAEPQGYHF